MNVVSFPAFKAMAKQIVDERPDFVYNPGGAASRCTYAPSVRAGGVVSRCLIGEILSRLGMTDEEFETYEGTAARKILFDLGFDSFTVQFATRLQHPQDNGKSWGEAYALAAELFEG